MGDANQSSVLHKPGAAFSGIFRYVPNYRWAIKVNLATASLRGDTRDFSNVFPEEKHYDFKRQLFDLGAQAEFIFLITVWGIPIRKRAVYLPIYWLVWELVLLRLPVIIFLVSISLWGSA